MLPSKVCFSPMGSRKILPDDLSPTDRRMSTCRRLLHCGMSAAAFLIIAGCAKETSDNSAADSIDEQSTVDETPYEDTLMASLLNANPGDVIEIPEGVFSFDRSLSLAVDGVTIRGAGMDKSILSFKNQAAGAEGLLVTGSDFTIEDLAIEDAKGDALKIVEAENIIIRRVRTEWTDGPKTENGAYGLYPVQTSNVLIEENVAIAASDAGIYVGQSKNVVIRNNRAEYNVAGIEVENTQDADVYDNVAVNNTGGILVFNMPNLPQRGARTRVFNNKVLENNTDNFGAAGTPVASVPAGTGIIVNSNDQVEIFNNEISDHGTGGVIISSVYSSGFADLSFSDEFDPYPEGIYIYDNQITESGANPGTNELSTLKNAMFGPEGALPEILWDGFVDPQKTVDGALPEDKRICVNNGDALIINVDAPNGFANPSVSSDDYQCVLPKLPAIKLTGALAAL